MMEVRAVHLARLVKAGSLVSKSNLGDNSLMKLRMVLIYYAKNFGRVSSRESVGVLLPRSIFSDAKLLILLKERNELEDRFRRKFVGVPTESRQNVLS